MFQYGNTQHPQSISPDAVLEVSNPANPTKRLTINAIVDSGAIITCIPASVIEMLGGLKYKPVSTVSLAGQQLILEKYTVNLRIIKEFETSAFEFRDVEVLAIPGKQYALIGRDILNNYKIILDGPNHTWSIETSEKKQIN
jgi:hypothetical protein